MSPDRKSEDKTRVIVASMLTTLYLGAMLLAASAGPPHPEPHQPDATHPRVVSNSRPKHLPRPSPWMIRATGWAVSLASQFS